MAELKMDFAKMADGFTKTAKEKGMFVGWWIPVSERLPKDEQKVLVTTRSGNIIYVDTVIYYHASPFWKHYVIAWMPLPQPYKGESEE